MVGWLVSSMQLPFLIFISFLYGLATTLIEDILPLYAAQSEEYDASMFSQFMSLRFAVVLLTCFLSPLISKFLGSEKTLSVSLAGTGVLFICFGIFPPSGTVLFLSMSSASGFLLMANISLKVLTQDQSSRQWRYKAVMWNRAASMCGFIGPIGIVYFSKASYWSSNLVLQSSGLYPVFFAVFGVFLVIVSISPLLMVYRREKKKDISAQKKEMGFFQIQSIANVPPPLLQFILIFSAANLCDVICSGITPFFILRDLGKPGEYFNTTVSSASFLSFCGILLLAQAKKNVFTTKEDLKKSILTLMIICCISLIVMGTSYSPPLLITFAFITLRVAIRSAAPLAQIWIATTSKITRLEFVFSLQKVISTIFKLSSSAFTSYLLVIFKIQQIYILLSMFMFFLSVKLFSSKPLILEKSN